ncbi:MAG: M23 family metallopeptidase [Chloroflexota bacterium]
MRPLALGSLFALLLVIALAVTPAVAATDGHAPGRSGVPRSGAGRSTAFADGGTAVDVQAMGGPQRVSLGLSGLFTTQLDGSAYSRGNCNMASAAMLFEVQTGRTLSGAAMRRLSGARTPGTTLADLKRAFRRLGQSVITREDMSWSSFTAQVRAGRSAVVMGWYGNLPRSVDLQPGFTGAHSVFVLGYSPSPFHHHGGFYVMDPLGQGQYDGMWWSRKTLKRFGWSGRPNHVGVGRAAFYGNVALQLTPTYKGRMNAKHYRPTFQSYWDTSKALMRHARNVTLVPRGRAGGSLVLRVVDPHLRLTPGRAKHSKMGRPLTSWKTRLRDLWVANDRLVLKTDPGAKVAAAAGGRVIYRGWDRTGMRMLWIQHGPHLYTVYKGLGSVFVEPGDWVGKGRTIGSLAPITTKVKVGKHKVRTVTNSKLYFVVAAGDPHRASSRQNPLRYIRK